MTELVSFSFVYSLCHSYVDPGKYLPDPTSDPAGSEPDSDTLDQTGSGSDPDPPNSPDIRSDPNLDPVHP